jgi:hypothetical protein
MKAHAIRPPAAAARTPRAFPAVRRILHAPAIQAKLEVGAANDPTEHEADRVADEVMRMPDGGAASSLGLPPAAPPAIRRKCDTCAEEDTVRRRADGPDGGGPAPASVREVLGSSGRPLDTASRAFFEPRFRHSFEHVRVHDGTSADAAARSINALAFTSGNDIAFARGEYRPGSPAGRHLLAHELTHTVQQGGGAALIRRQTVPEMPNEADFAAEREYGDSGAPKAKKCGPPAHCPPGFCDPYRSEELAKYYRAKNSVWIMAGISLAVDSRVVPYWQKYLSGGSAPEDLSSKFGADFTNSPTTKKATAFLHAELKNKLQLSPPKVAESTTVSVDLMNKVPSAITKLDDPSSKDRMNFNIPSDIPGNLAGDIGKDQDSCTAGNMPSPFNDERHASGYAKAVRTGSTITVTPAIQYKVQDTIDLCPGDCGTQLEQNATVPLSQFEATGISGDVPFTVTFPAPPLGSFTITDPLPSSLGGSPSPKKP